MSVDTISSTVCLEAIQEAEAAAFAAELPADVTPPSQYLAELQDLEAETFTADMPAYSPSNSYSSLYPPTSSSYSHPTSDPSNSSPEWSLSLSPTILGHHQPSQPHSYPRTTNNTTFIPSPTTSFTTSSPQNHDKTYLHPKTLFPP